MRRMLFLSRYGQRRGGHITARDYFVHAAAHPQVKAYVYFPPSSDRDNDVWADVPRDHVVDRMRLPAYDALMLYGLAWKMLPDDLGDLPVVQLILHVRHGAHKPIDPSSL